MQADIRHFRSICQLSSETVLDAIECFHEGNPFSGNLVLTDYRLAFVSSEKLENLSRSFPLEHISNLSTQVEDVFNLTLVIKLLSGDQRFELRGSNFATKKRFVERLEHQLFSKASDRYAG